MDQQTFDRLTRLFRTAGSRRTAWRAILGAALFGATTCSAAAQQCPDRKHRCGADCCPGKCFRDELNESCEACCTEKNNNIICVTAGGPVCCRKDEKVDPCAVVQATGKCPAPPAGAVGETCTAGIAGSYRRRR
jgi:hypothetical protein